MKFMREFRQRLYVNCWHMNEHESLAMWKLYTSMNDSICVQSTYRRLWDCLPTKGIHVGTVTYIDYDLERFEDGNVFNPIMHKRKSFSHEREVRAVAWEAPTGPNLEGDTPSCKIIPVDIRGLIEGVYVAPDCSPLLVEVVQGLLEAAGLKLDVKQSGVNAPPGY